jgi:hypothetical protein
MNLQSQFVDFDWGRSLFVDFWLGAIYLWWGMKWRSLFDDID